MQSPTCTRVWMRTPLLATLLVLPRESTSMVMLRAGCDSTSASAVPCRRRTRHVQMQWTVTTSCRTCIAPAQDRHPLHSRTGEAQVKPLLVHSALWPFGHASRRHVPEASGKSSEARGEGERLCRSPGGGHQHGCQHHAGFSSQPQPAVVCVKASSLMKPRFPGSYCTQLIRYIRG